MTNTFMIEPWTLNIIWWISAIELPILASLFWIISRTQSDFDTALDDARHETETSLRFLRESLLVFKLEVAKSCASVSYLKEFERRLTSHLIRVEDRIRNLTHRDNINKDDPNDKS